MKSSNNLRRVAAALLAACVATTSFTSTASAEEVAAPATGYIPYIPILFPIFPIIKPMQSSCELSASASPTPWFTTRDIKVTGYMGWSVDSAKIRYEATATGTYTFRLVLRDVDRSGDMITKSEVKTINLTAGVPTNVTTYFGNAYLGKALNFSISHEDKTGPGTLYMAQANVSCPNTTTTAQDGSVDGTVADIGYELRGDSSHSATTVVEYYLPGANKYFITGRDAEKTLLDGMPATFVRTGKTFRVPSKQVYGNVFDVYRFYAPAPGANSHVFVDKADHDLIVSVSGTGLVDEGADYGSIKPDSAGTCPSWAPVKIYRSFHNTAAVGNRNHRYTDNTTDYNAMTSQGWVPEGVVFCAYNS
jgi:Repeat of unknown function (DUF5648)